MSSPFAEKVAVGGPPLPAAPLGSAFGATDGPEIELFLDLACPFSRKLFMSAYGDETVRASGARFVMHQVPQPWHWQSAVMHEAALAVRQLRRDAYFPFVAAVFAAQESYVDSAVAAETREAVATRLAALAEAACGVPAAEVRGLLATGEGNSGTAVTQQVKWAVKHHRARGVHVTPTVFVHGIEAPQVSSSYSKEQWLELVGELRVKGGWAA